MACSAHELTTKRDLRDFLRLPWEIYQGDPYWVPPLVAEMKDKLDPRRNPFFEYGTVRLFGVRDDGGPLLARAAAILNPRHNARHGDRTGFFGLFESRNDPRAADLLFRRIRRELRGRGCDAMVGPVNFTTNDECGVLVEGFGSRPAIMTSHNPAYYDALLLRCGLEKEIDLFSYGWSVEHVYPGRCERLFSRLRARTPVGFRPIDRRKLGRELRIVEEIYNTSFADVRGFVPLTSAETAAMGKAFKLIADDDLVFFAEVGSRPVGFCLALPDINEVLKDLDGRLWPTGLLRFLFRKGGIRSVRIMVLGVLPEYRARGVAALLIDHLRETGSARGYRTGELSVVLESNRRMIEVIEDLGFARVKRFRLYRSALPAEDGR